MNESKSKILRHNVYITTAGDATGRFQAAVSCPFIPTEVKVRALTYVSVLADGVPLSLHVDSMGESEARLAPA